MYAWQSRDGGTHRQTQQQPSPQRSGTRTAHTPAQPSSLARRVHKWLADEFGDATAGNGGDIVHRVPIGDLEKLCRGERAAAIWEYLIANTHSEQ